MWCFFHVQTDALIDTEDFVNNNVGRREKASYTLKNPFSSPFPFTLCPSLFLEESPDKVLIILELW